MYLSTIHLHTVHWLALPLVPLLKSIEQFLKFVAARMIDLTVSLQMLENLCEALCENSGGFFLYS